MNTHRYTTSAAVDGSTVGPQDVVIRSLVVESMTAESFRILWSDSRIGDRGALVDWVVRWSWYYLRPDADAVRDCAQEAGVQFWKNLQNGTVANWIGTSRHSPSGALRIYARYLARQCARLIRRKTRGDLVDPSTAAAMLDAGGFSTLNEALEGVTRPDIRWALQQLAPSEREIIVLRYWESLTFSEIGALLCISEATARTKHHRVIAKIRRHLAA